MSEPRRWTLAELERDAEEATSVFREERLKESLSQNFASTRTPPAVVLDEEVGPTLALPVKAVPG